MYAIACLQGMVFYGPVATLYRQAAGVTIFQITIIESISLALCILLEVPWGIVADKIGYRRTMILSCGLFFVSKIIFWQANGFGGFLMERVLLSIVFAGMSGVDASMLYLSSERGMSQRAFGVYHNLGMTGLLAAAAVYSCFIGQNYRLAGLLTAISYGAAALLAFALQEVKTPEDACKRRAGLFRALFKQTLANRRLMLLVLAAALLNETHQTITVFLNQLQYVKAGMAPGVIAAVYILTTVSGLLGGLSARITDRFGPRGTGLSLFLLCCVACVALAVTSNAIVSVLAVVALRVGHSLFQPLQTELQNRAITAENRATALSLNAVFMNAIAVLTNLGFGRIAEIDLGFAMLFGCTLCAVGYVLYLIACKGGIRPRANSR